MACTLGHMQSLSNERRLTKKARRHQVRRRRLMAIAVVVPLVIGAIWAAYAWPAPKPARVPGANVVSQFAQSGSVDRQSWSPGSRVSICCCPSDSTPLRRSPFIRSTKEQLALTPVGQPGDPQASPALWPTSSLTAACAISSRAATPATPRAAPPASTWGRCPRLCLQSRRRSRDRRHHLQAAWSLHRHRDRAAARRRPQPCCSSSPTSPRLR